LLVKQGAQGARIEDWQYLVVATSWIAPTQVRARCWSIPRLAHLAGDPLRADRQSNGEGGQAR